MKRAKTFIFRHLRHYDSFEHKRRVSISTCAVDCSLSVEVMSRAHETRCPPILCLEQSSVLETDNRPRTCSNCQSSRAGSRWSGRYSQSMR